MKGLFGGLGTAWKDNVKTMPFKMYFENINFIEGRQEPV